MTKQNKPKAPPGPPSIGTPPPMPPQTQQAEESKPKPKKRKDKWELAAERRARHKQRIKTLNILPGQKLAAPSKPGMHRRWVNDDGNRLEEMQEKGYEFVEDDDPLISSTDTGSRKSQLVDHKEGRPVRGYLMETPEEFFKEDKAEKMERLRRIDDQVRQAKVGGSQGIGSDPHLNKPSSVSENQLLED